jgi:hypothetical protein
VTSEPVYLSQTQLVALIAEFVEKHGATSMIPRQVNAIINAANLIVAEFKKPFQPAVPGMGLKAWMKCDETGDSSMFMARVLAGYLFGSCHHPHDPDDFMRCVKLLEAEPKFRNGLSLMRKRSHVWAKLVEHWEELETLYREELPMGSAPKLYARMKELGC